MKSTITFGLLGLAICSVWFPPIRFGKQMALPPWPLLFIAAVVAGLFSGYVTWVGTMILAAFAILVYFAKKPLPSRAWRAIAGVLVLIAALALGLHVLPGYQPAVLVPAVRISAEAPPYNLHASFDKASVGIFLVALLSNRVRSHSEWRLVLERTWPIALATTACVITAAVAAGFVRLDPKLSQYTPVFLATNLLFTCVTEEAFFRGFLQERMAGLLKSIRFGSFIAVVCAGILFGLAHFRGGPTYVVLASIAGIGYGYAYAFTKRIEAAILTHISVNAVHFLGFTYPYLK
jgi:membrane protease YdiL (CAAX protease family)